MLLVTPRTPLAAVALWLALAAPLPAQGQRPFFNPRPPQRRLMPVGDSITQGGNQFASWRYWLWFTLPAEPAIDFVGQRSTVFPDDFPANPNPEIYPQYYGGFDPDHQAYWGARTDHVADLILRGAREQRPDIVLVHLGTNDVAQLGAWGLSHVRFQLPRLITNVRAASPAAVFLVAQVIPTRRNSIQDLIPPLNEVIAEVVAAESTPASPVVLVDQYSGFDLEADLQPWGLHPNVSGEKRMANVWLASLEQNLMPPRPPRHPEPTVLDPSFEASVILDPFPDVELHLPAWRFGATRNTYYGFLDPDSDTYLGAKGSGVPLGADGPSVAFLYDAGPGNEAVVLYQTLPTTCEPGKTYNLTVAVGNRLPTNPFGPSTFGGFRIELLAGNEVLAAISDTFVPPPGEFWDAHLSVRADELPVWLCGQALTVRLGMTSKGQGLATDFDNVRLDTERPDPPFASK